jgi:hypothetical protein
VEDTTNLLCFYIYLTFFFKPRVIESADGDFVHKAGLLYIEIWQVFHLKYCSLTNRNEIGYFFLVCFFSVLLLLCFLVSDLKQKFNIFTCSVISIMLFQFVKSYPFVLQEVVGMYTKIVLPSLRHIMQRFNAWSCTDNWQYARWQ